MLPETRSRPSGPWVLLLGLLLLCIPAAHPAKCPQHCICDQIQLTVACVRKNLTQVPPAVDEVWDSSVHVWGWLFCPS